MFGAVEGAELEPEVAVQAEASETASKGLLRSMASLGGTRKPSLDTLRTGKEDNTASSSSAEKSALITSGDEGE